MGSSNSYIEKAQASDRELRKALGLLEIMFLVLGAIIGSGWLFGSFYAAAMAGPAAITSWIIAGVLLLFVALAFAELSGAIPKTGAIVRYPQYSHGSFASTLLGWAYFLSAVTVAPAEAEAAVTYLSTWWPSKWPPLTYSTTVAGVTVTLLTGVGFAIAFAFLTAFFLLNWFGVRLLGAVTHGAGWWKLVIPFATVILILVLIFHPANFASLAYSGGNITVGNKTYSFSPAHGFAPYGWAPVFFALPTTGIVFAYLGFRQGLEYAGEAKNPQRDVPLGTILGFIIAIVLYVLLQVSFVGGIDWSRYQMNLTYTYPNGTTVYKVVQLSPGNWQGLGYTVLSSGPFYELLAVSGIGILLGWAFILLIDAVVSPSGTGWIYEGTTTRVLYGMAADGVLPEWFLRLNKYRIPWIALITSWLLGALFMVPYSGWALMVSFISLTTVLTYIIGGSALMVLRRTVPNMPRPFRVGSDRVAWVIAAIAFIASFLIVYWSTFSVLWLAATFILVGVSLYYMMVAPSRFGVSRAHGVAAGVVFWAILAATTYFLVWRNVMSVAPVPVDARTVGSLVGFVVVNLGAAVGLTEWLKGEMNEEGRAHTNAGYWVLAVLFGAYTLSWLGQYGPFTSPIIPFPWDTVVTALVALALFFYSVYSGIFTRDLDAVLRELGVAPVQADGGGKGS
ncbi:APC family permease [Acidilobus saccharovorans]|uniref:APC family permease n=1 Tax=Acidilobus saccharovorans TaxID=242703 RepID=UPI000A673942|nr:APC family permease [Acidilobus saccharovorans]